ncbi:MAG: hypothetical protein LBF27_21850 [Sphingobacterium sp.]|jgi:hypothetical protein|nr:hypothetical protein [Sphingobacterium sp.]
MIKSPQFTFKTFLMVLVTLLFGCKKEEKRTFDFIFTSSIESRLNMNEYFPITVGNGDYTIKVKDETILDAYFTNTANAHFGAIRIQGKKKGETTVTITDNVIQSTREVQVKITDSYLPFAISKSNHPTLTKAMHIFLVNNTKKDAYFFLQKGNDLNFKQKGTFEFIAELKEGVKTPFLLLTYSTDEKGQLTASSDKAVTHKFDLTGSDRQVYNALVSIFGVNWELTPTTKTSPIDIPYLNMKEVGTDLRVSGLIGGTSPFDYIPPGYLD